MVLMLLAQIMVRLVCICVVGMVPHNFVKGIYLLSTLIQLRTSFPSDDVEENLFKTLPEYVVFGGTFDGSFLFAVVVTGLARWLDDKVNK
jgi:hypothetical protein